MPQVVDVTQHPDMEPAWCERLVEQWRESERNMQRHLDYAHKHGLEDVAASMAKGIETNRKSIAAMELRAQRLRAAIACGRIVLTGRAN